ncbi:hypothetical protein [Alkalibacillus silvisoli]|uniref:DUF3961 domain-containing protein n=1 Tax=Alkalibacillus silvisoli TaxID=392823 RepID=A0ABN0ZQP0_9BACI
MKLLRKIDSYFLYDEVTGESAPISDYLWFYGTLGFLLTFLAIFTYKLITF